MVLEKFGNTYISTRSTNPKPTPPFRQFSFGRNHLFHPPFLVKQARLVTFSRREAARDVIARTGRSTVKAPSACFAFLHSRVSFARRFLRMNKPGLHPPAAARHPLPGAQSSLAAGKLLVCPPTSLFSHLPPGSSSSSSSSVDVARRRTSTTTLHLTGQLWRCPNSPRSDFPPLLVTANESRPGGIDAALFSSFTLSFRKIGRGELAISDFIFQELNNKS